LHKLYRLFCISIIGGIADVANAQIGRLGPFGIVIITKVGVPMCAETLVKKATLNDERCFAIDQILRDLLRIELYTQIIDAESRCGKNHLSHNVASAER
jgi:hypothetical protein